MTLFQYKPTFKPTSLRKKEVHEGTPINANQIGQTISTQFTSRSHIFRFLQNFQINSFLLFLSYQGSNQNSKWCSNGVVSALPRHENIDFTGFSGTFQDTAVAYE